MEGLLPTHNNPVVRHYFSLNVPVRRRAPALGASVITITIQLLMLNGLSTSESAWAVWPEALRVHVIMVHLDPDGVFIWFPHNAPTGSCVPQNPRSCGHVSHRC
jgi:hypothetical protein